MSDHLDELLRAADPVTPGDDLLHARVALVSAQARAAVAGERRRVRRRRAVMATAATGALLSVGAVAAATGGGVLSWEWLDRPDVRSSVELPSGQVCDVALAAWPEDGEVRYDGDPVVAAAAASMSRIDMATLDISDALAQEYATWDVLPPGVERPAPTYPPGTNPRALPSVQVTSKTADEAYQSALLDTVDARVTADLRAQGITARSGYQAALDCSGQSS